MCERERGRADLMAGALGREGEAAPLDPERTTQTRPDKTVKVTHKTVTTTNKTVTAINKTVTAT